MSYTTEELVKAYTAVHVGVVPPPEVRATFMAVAGGGASDSQILSNILNGADNSTALAVMSYQFFTGRSPTQVGMSYLVNSPYNPTDLNDAYYSGFNIENRYINFAANLGVVGEGAFAFANKYGEMSFADYVASIYQTIIGRTMATTAGVDVDAAIAYLISTKAAVQATVAAAGVINANSTPTQIDLAVKAAMAGLVMAAAIKADIGLYAAATDNFMVALATGTAVYGTDITKTYAPSADTFAHGTGKAIDRDVPLTPTTPTAPADSARTLRLTTGTDSLAGGTANDTFNADDADGLGGHFAVLTTGDTLNGGAGTDTLNIVSGAGATLTLPVVTVTGIETVNVTGDNSVTANTAAWTGVTALNVTSVGAATVTAAAGVAITTTASSQASGNITVDGGSNVTITATGATTGNVTVGNTVAPTGSIVVSRTSSVTGNAGVITVNGGTTVDITQVATNAVATTQTYGTIVVNGGATTTSVSVHNPAKATASGSVAGVNGNTVSIIDKNGSGASTKSTITSISVDGATTVGIQDNALSSLSVAHTSGNLIIDNSSSLASGDLTKTLNLTISGTTGGTLDDADVYTTLNVTTGSENSVLANLTFGAMTALSIGGSSKLTFTSTAGSTALQTVTVTGAAGITANLSGATVTSVNASATSGANTVTIDASKATFSGGSGVDTVVLTATAANKGLTLGLGNDSLDITAVPTVTGGTFDAGGGTQDVLKMSAAQAATASGSGVFATTFTNFERLVLTGSTNQTIDLAVIGPYHHVTTSGGNGLTLNNFSSGDTLVLNGAGTAYTVGAGNFGGGSDAFNLQLTDGSTAGVSFASTGITATGVEILNVSTADTQTTPTGSFKDSVTWLGNTVQTINASGNAGLTMTATSTALTTVDASGITLGGFSWTSGALAGSATIKGSTTGANTVNFAAALGDNAYTGGTGVDTVTANGGQNTINVGTGNDVVNVTAANVASDTVFTTITGFGTGDKLGLAAQGGAATATTLGAEVTGQASLAAYLDAAAAGDGSGVALVQWFTFGGDTYVVQDSSANATFDAGIDIVVKLVGGPSLTTSSFAAGVLTV